MRCPTEEERKAMYWLSNETWYRFNEETNHYELTDEATEEARESFELDRKIKERHLRELKASQKEITVE